MDEWTDDLQINAPLNPLNNSCLAKSPEPKEYKELVT